MRAGEAGGWKRAMFTVAGVEERELKHEAVLLQAFQKPILRMGYAWAKMGVLCRAMPGAMAAASGAA